MKRFVSPRLIESSLSLSTIPYVDGGYRTILIDPPWPYEQKLDVEKTRGGAQKHYESLTLEEIESLHPEQFANDDCQLWLWVTNTHLPFFSRLLDAWKFEYRTMRTWVKGRVERDRLIIHFGLGYWLRGATEHLILATRGNPRSKFDGPHGATGGNISTVILASREEHSKKPEESYVDIERMSNEPRLELFARKKRNGWTTWGDQLE